MNSPQNTPTPKTEKQSAKKILSVFENATPREKILLYLYDQLGQSEFIASDIDVICRISSLVSKADPGDDQELIRLKGIAEGLQFVNQHK